MIDVALQPQTAARAKRTIRGDVGPAGGDIDHDGDLEVGGSIVDGMTVVVSGGIQVVGAVESADLKATGDISVAGGIAARGKARCHASGSIKCKFANGAILEAGGDVSVETEIVTSRIIAGGAFRAENCQVTSGHITANAGAICGTLGNNARAEIIIECGFDERLRRLGDTRAPEILKNLERVHRVQTQIAPLLQHQKQLIPRQKEAATELIYDAEQLRETTQTMIQTLRGAVAALSEHSKPELIVNQLVRAGAIIRFEGTETAIKEDLPGPVRIFMEMQGITPRIFYQPLSGGIKHPLETVPCPDAKLALLRQAIA